MFVTAGHHDAEVRVTLEAAIDLVNLLADSTDVSHRARSSATGRQDLTAEVRGLLVQHGFTRAPDASVASLQRVEARMRRLVPKLRSLPDDDIVAAVRWVNEELHAIRIEPSLTSHDGAPLHLHWTSATATFDDQVAADVLMALAQELVQHGTDRFGTCAAAECASLFYDTTKNRSRRFCADPRCASRTHTAEHRARRRQR